MTTQQEFNVEIEKLKLERQKAFLTAISIFIPLIIAAAGFLINSWNQTQQQKAQFVIQAAQIVMDSQNASATLNRAKALAALFPEFLPADFASSFDPSSYGGPSTTDGKKAILQLLIEHPDQRQYILETWKLLFPGDTWINDLAS